MATIIGGARHDENGKYTGGKAGDQLQSGSGDDYSGECSMCDFYVHKYGWYVIRAKEAALANKLAERMIALCNNAHIGYDQDGRYGIITYGIDTKTDTECDCSTGVRECVKEASGVDPGDFTTGNEVSVLEATGLFESKIAYTSSTKLYVGDILVSQQKGHTAIICYGNARTSSSSSGTSSSGSGTTSSGTTSSAKEDDYAQSGPDSSIAGTYTVTASSGLNIRYGIDKDVKVTIPKGTEVHNYGYYSIMSGVKWLYVQFVYNGREYTGYASSQYLSKKSTSSSSSSLPTYKVNSTYKTQVDHLAVRSTPEVKPDNKYTKSQLSNDGKKHAHDDGCLEKGTSVTCKATRTVNGDVWMQIPSGWVAAYYGGKKYIS